MITDLVGHRIAEFWSLADSRLWARAAGVAKSGVAMARSSTVAAYRIVVVFPRILWAGKPVVVLVNARR